MAIFFFEASYHFKACGRSVSKIDLVKKSNQLLGTDPARNGASVSGVR